MHATLIVLAELPVPAAIMDADGRIAEVNEAWRRRTAGNSPGIPQPDVGTDLLFACRGHGSEQDDALADRICDVLAEKVRCYQGNCRWLAGASGGCGITVTPLCRPDGARAALILLTVPGGPGPVEPAHDDAAYDQLLFQANPQPMWVYDLETLAFLAVNNAAIAKYGYSRQEFLAMTIKDIRPSEDVPRLLRNIASVQDGLDQAGYWRHCRKDGTIIVVEITSHVLEFAGRRSELVVAMDVTDRCKAEQDLARARDEAEAANRAKDRFLAALSHELRTPLTPVLAALSVLEDETQLPPALQGDIAMMRRSVELEARLIDDLLDMTRLAHGRLRLNLQQVDGQEVLQQALQITRPDMQARRLAVELRLDARRAQVNADPVRLQQVFWNLLKNAAKFTPSSGRITVRSYNDPSQRWVVQVADSGIGIAPAVLRELFQPFQQSRSPAHQFGGLGLGLFISKSIVHVLGGSIEAASAGPGHGATFTVVLPTLDTPAVVPPTPPARLPAAVPAPSLRMLLVEDDPNTARVLARLLRNRGHRVTVAESMQAALATASKCELDVLISDIGLPDGTGWELMQQLRDRPGLKGIALSGYGMEDDVRKSREAGFGEHLVKPVDLQRLIAAIQSAARCSAATGV